MKDPTRDYPDSEIESSLASFGDWFGWLASPELALEALRWKAARGDELPEQLEPLLEVLAQFGRPTIENAVARIQHLEKVFAEIARLRGGIHGNTAAAKRIRAIVGNCVRSSGHFDDVKVSDLFPVGQDEREEVGREEV